MSPASASAAASVASPPLYRALLTTTPTSSVSPLACPPAHISAWSLGTGSFPSQRKSSRCCQAIISQAPSKEAARDVVLTDVGHQLEKHAIMGLQPSVSLFHVVACLKTFRMLCTHTSLKRSSVRVEFPAEQGFFEEGSNCITKACAT